MQVALLSALNFLAVGQDGIASMPLKFRRSCVEPPPVISQLLGAGGADASEPPALPSLLSEKATSKPSRQGHFEVTYSEDEETVWVEASSLHRRGL
jgi:hypothetical protein